MDVSCPSCAARYVADDEKLRGKTARMRCKACSTVWMVTGTPDGATAIPSVKMAAASKPAAVVKKGSEREQRDLFAIQEPEVGSVKQSYSPPPSYSGVSTGARNETSVLFRVDQIRSAARAKTPIPHAVAEAAEPPKGRVSRSDDEGVLDLKSLSSTPPRVVVPPLSPLFSEAPPVAFDLDAPLSLGRLSSKKRLFAAIGAAAAFAVLMFASLSYVFKSDEPMARATASLAAPVETVVPPPAAVAPPPAAVAEAEATDPPKETKGKRGKGGKFKGAKSTATAAKAPAPKAAPKAADPCGCKGNFNCILACTAKGH